MEKLEAGMMVVIYQKPLTQEDREGVAELVHESAIDQPKGEERWKVAFDFDEGVFERTIRVGRYRIERLGPEGWEIERFEDDQETALEWVDNDGYLDLKIIDTEFQVAIA